MALEQIGSIEAKTGISRLTLEHLYWRVLSNNNLDTASAAVAFSPNTVTAKPTPAQFTAAAIVVDPDDEARKAVRLLFGPGGDIELTPSGDDPVTYKVWVRIDIWSGPGATGTLEQSIVRSVGTLVVR
jgi:hypothetical protein